MQTFKDSATGKIHQYDDGVDVSKVKKAPKTLEPYEIPDPTQEELDKKAQKAINNESLAYLALTDWYIIRLQETNVDVPADILTARADARLAVIPVV